MSKNAPPKSGKGFKLPLPKLSLPKLGAPKLPAGKLPKVKINPSALDGTFVLSMLLVGGLSAGSAALAIRFAMPQQVVIQRPAEAEQASSFAHNPDGYPDVTTGPNVTTDFSLTMERPVISSSAYVHPQASVIGYVSLGEHVFVAPQAAVRADEGKNIFIGDDSSIQDGAVVHGLPTEDKGARKMENVVVVNGDSYSVYIGSQVTVSAQSQVYGPAVVSDNAFIGMQALVFKARVGEGSVLEPRAAAIGVNIPDGRYVPAGVVVTTQEQADNLPKIAPGYAYLTAGAHAVRVNTQLAQGYRALYPIPGQQGEQSPHEHPGEGAAAAPAHAGEPGHGETAADHAAPAAGHEAPAQQAAPVDNHYEPDVLSPSAGHGTGH